jgi:peptide-methionine (R)-S-oxide reductase
MIVVALASGGLCGLFGCAPQDPSSESAKPARPAETPRAATTNQDASQPKQQEEPMSDTPAETPKPSDAPHCRLDQARSREEWKQLLTPEQFHIAFQGGTEAPFTGEYWDHHQAGTYSCVACGRALFASGTKFDSGTGWPSFYQPVADNAVTEHRDTSHGMERTEVRCGGCGAHLGHVFDDGPPPTGRRHCINSASLKFCPAEE